jgi:hypothetical protein
MSFIRSTNKNLKKNRRNKKKKKIQEENARTIKPFMGRKKDHKGTCLSYDNIEKKR